MPIAVELSEYETAKKGGFYKSVKKERERRVPGVQFAPVTVDAEGSPIGVLLMLVSRSYV